MVSLLQRPLIAVVGPTGSGKSSLAIAIATEFHGEIVNCDSLQLYRGFDVGTAKTPISERADIPHYLFDVLTQEQSYSAGDYARAARAVIEAISNRGNLPVIVGGTGFYLRALLFGLPQLPGRDEGLRARLQSREVRRPGSLHRLLARLEPKAAGRIHSNDAQKILRALEVRLLTRSPIPTPTQAKPLEGYRVVQIGLNPERAHLKERLDVRTRAMFLPAGTADGGAGSQGLVAEVRGLLAAGASGTEKPFESLGYKQALQHLRGEATLEQAIESTQVETRQYAKRQVTWFRREPGVHWIEDFGDSAHARDAAFRFIRSTLLPSH